MKKSDIKAEVIFNGVKQNRLIKLTAEAALCVLIKKECIKKPFVVVFTNNKTIKKINKLYRYKNESTDVLSFEYGEDSELLGEIMISLETAKKQMLIYGNSFLKEVLILLIHGFYHILGYKHYRKQDYNKMKNKETAALAFIKFKGEKL